MLSKKFRTDNVYIYAGAKVIGNVTIGKKSKLGANTVVVKNVSPNCTVGDASLYCKKRWIKRKRTFIDHMNTIKKYCHIENRSQNLHFIYH